MSKDLEKENRKLREELAVYDTVVAELLAAIPRVSEDYKEQRDHAMSRLRQLNDRFHSRDFANYKEDK